MRSDFSTIVIKFFLSIAATINLLWLIILLVDLILLARVVFLCGSVLCLRHVELHPFIANLLCAACQARRTHDLE